VHKDTVETFSNNNVVYKISCIDCEASYVGQTKRQLKTRVREHFSNLTSKSANLSVITEHTLQTSHSFDWDNVKILDTERNYFKRLISEMLHIREQSYGLNAQKDTEMLDSAFIMIFLIGSPGFKVRSRSPSVFYYNIALVFSFILVKPLQYT